jgi:hypothetical protein
MKLAPIILDTADVKHPATLGVDLGINECDGGQMLFHYGYFGDVRFVISVKIHNIGEWAYNIRIFILKRQFSGSFSTKSIDTKIRPSPHQPILIW